jgi:excisionase family DNA binding protein
MPKTSPQDVPILAVNYEGTCKALGLSRPTVVRLVEQGQLRPIRVGSRRLFAVSELERFLATGGDDQ